MANHGKIDFEQLHQLLADGKTTGEIAKYFSVTPGAVSQARKKLRISVVKSVSLENAHRVVDKSLNAVDQLQSINEKANELLETAMKIIRGEESSGAMKGDPRDVALKSMQEIRNQLRLQLDIFQALYDIKAVQEFQQEVLSSIAEVSPETKDAIIAKLTKRQALRSAIEWD